LNCGVELKLFSKQSGKTNNKLGKTGIAMQNQSGQTSNKKLVDR